VCVCGGGAGRGYISLLFQIRPRRELVLSCKIFHMTISERVVLILYIIVPSCPVYHYIHILFLNALKLSLSSSVSKQILSCLGPAEFVMNCNLHFNKRQYSIISDTIAVEFVNFVVIVLKF
jgi:hypothetical protein